MICPKCNEGEFRSYGTRFSKRLGGITRKRVCNKCNHTILTIEVNRDIYAKDYRMITILQKAIEDYNKPISS